MDAATNLINISMTAIGKNGRVMYPFCSRCKMPAGVAKIGERQKHEVVRDKDSVSCSMGKELPPGKANKTVDPRIATSVGAILHIDCTQSILFAKL
jgi:hypothetical protein